MHRRVLWGSGNFYEVDKGVSFHKSGATPTYYDPYCGDYQKGAPNSWRPPEGIRIRYWILVKFGDSGELS